MLVSSELPSTPSAVLGGMLLSQSGLRQDASIHSADELEVGPARSDVELEEVHRLTHAGYVERGYCVQEPSGKLNHYPHLEGCESTTVLVAWRGGEILGSVTLTLDGPRGLPADADFRQVCDGIRREGRRLGAVWRLITRADIRSERRIVMALIRNVVLQAFHTEDLQTFLCTFHPRHERFYRRILNMKTLARAEGTKGLQSAPGVLMRCDIEGCPGRWLV